MSDKHGQNKSASSGAPARRRRPSSATTKPPTKQEQLREQEQRINEAQRRYDFTTGHCLREIRDKKLYLANHRTWENYLEERWGRSKSSADRLIAAVGTEEKLRRMLTEAAGERGGDVANWLPPEGETILRNEWEARRVQHRLPRVIERFKAGDSLREAIAKTIHEAEEEKRQEQQEQEPTQQEQEPTQPVQAAQEDNEPASKRGQGMRGKRGSRKGDTTTAAPATTDRDDPSAKVGELLSQVVALLRGQGGMELLKEHPEQAQKLAALLGQAGWKVKS
jgi:hypothetical protein